MTMQVDKARLDEILAGDRDRALMIVSGTALNHPDPVNDDYRIIGWRVPYSKELGLGTALLGLDYIRAAVTDALRSLRSTEGKEDVIRWTTRGGFLETTDRYHIMTDHSPGAWVHYVDHADLVAQLLSQAEAEEAHTAKLRDHIEQLVELLETIKEHWVDYDHIYSIAVHEARAALTRSPE